MWSEYNGTLIYTGGTKALLTYIYIQPAASYAPVGTELDLDTAHLVFNMPATSENALAYLTAYRLAMKAGDMPELVSMLQAEAVREGTDLLGTEFNPND